MRCMSAFLDMCYIACCQDICNDALEAFDAAKNKFLELREVFRTSGVRPTEFSLLCQHALFHYCRQIEDFGAPGGLCSSIMESRHITAVKRPWRQSNRYNALGQMLVTNQRLDRLAAMQSNFIARGMLPGGHKLGKNMTTHVFKPKNSSRGEEDDAWPAEEENILGNVVLAQTRGMSFTLVTLIITLIQNPLIIKHANILEIYMSYQKKLKNQIYLS
jgi:hypothetical protein